MSTQNKITSYFCKRNSSDQIKVNKKSLKTSKVSYTINKSEDCIVIDDDDDENVNENENNKEVDIEVKTNESFEKENDIPNEKEMEEMLQVIWKEDYDEYSASTSNRNFKQFDDTTIFFANMVDNFLTDVSLHYLFSSDEINLLNRFSELPTINHKKIYARMYWLQWKWHKISSIVNKYLNIDVINDFTQNIMKELINKGFLLNDESMNFEDWATVVNKADLIKICKHFKIKTDKLDKDSLLGGLRKFSENKSSIFNRTSAASKTMNGAVMKMMTKTMGECVKISDFSKCTFDRLHILVYLGMNPAILRDKQLNLMLINLKNGKQSFPTEDINIDSPKCVFPTKSFFDEYYNARNLYEKILKFTTSPPCDHDAVIDIAKECYEIYKKINRDKNMKDFECPIWLHRFTPLYIYVKALEASIGSFKALKTDEHLNLALSIISSLLKQKKYRQHKRSLWYNEKALILHTRFRHYEKAADVLISALEENEISEDAKAQLKDRAKRLALQKNISLSDSLRRALLKLSGDVKPDLPFIEISAKSLDETGPGKKAKYVFRDVVSDEKVYSSVEHYALLHYINNFQYSDGEHWEGRITTSIFVLLFWDIIYADSEKGTGIFISKFQDAPLDLYSDFFYINRKDKIDKRLENIESGWETFEEIVDFMKNIFDSRKPGEVSLLISNLDWSKIHEIITCLGRKGLHCICKRLSQSYHYFHSGFPDLTVWNYSTKKIKFVEVKGDGDKLSHKQIQWMTYLLSGGIETEVCYVHKGLQKRRVSKKNVEKTQEKEKAVRKRKVDTEKHDVEKKSTRKKKSNPEKMASDLSNAEINDPKPEFSGSLSQNTTKKSPATKASPKNFKYSPKKLEKSQSFTECYLKSPTKFCKGVGYFVSPSKSLPNSQSPKKNDDSPNKSQVRKRLSLSLTRRRIFEKDL